MKLRAMTFSADEDPETITVDMSLAEAVFLTKVLGDRNPQADNEVMADGGDHSYEIYECLSSVFNRHFENGVNEALRAL